MNRLTITVEKARNLRAATDRARDIADRFYGVAPGDDRPYTLEQTGADTEQVVVTTAAGGVVASTDTFSVTFEAVRR